MRLVALTTVRLACVALLAGADTAPSGEVCERGSWDAVRAALSAHPDARPISPSAPELDGFVVDDAVPDADIDALLALLSSRVAPCGGGGHEQPEGVYCFDPASVSLDPRSGAAAYSALPAWLDAAIAAGARVEGPGVLCVDAAAHADAIRAADARPPSVSLVSLPDEHAALRRVAARLEDLAALPREHGLMQQLLVYAPGAHGYAAHTDCRSDAFARGADGAEIRASTALLYLTDADGLAGATVFPRARNATARPRRGRLAVWNNLDASGGCNAAAEHIALPLPAADSAARRARRAPLDGAKIVLQRWFEPTAASARARNDHASGVAKTRCSLDAAGAVETCRQYCASHSAARADAHAARAYDAWGRWAARPHDGETPLELLAEAARELEAVLAEVDHYAMVQLLLAFALTEPDAPAALRGGDASDASEEALCRRARSLLLSFVESVPTGPMADQAHSMLEDEAGAAGPWCHGTSEEPTTGAPS